MTMPKMETSNTSTHVGKDCLRTFFMSLWGSGLFASPIDLPICSNKGLASSEACSARFCSGTDFSESCCSSYFSTNSGNKFLNFMLLEKEVR